MLFASKVLSLQQNNKRSLLGRKQQSQVARSFPNRYQFSCTNKVTSLFSISCILRIILACQSYAFTCSKQLFCLVKVMLLAGKRAALGRLLTRKKWGVFGKWLVVRDLLVFNKCSNAWLICDQKNPDAK